MMKDERLVLKMEDITISFEATETVWWRDLIDPDLLIILRHIYASDVVESLYTLGLFSRCQEWALF